tara:strand:- start:1769 stop:2014 length:246 start_codon:yes stop_codon:yes gene_type:complete
MINIFVCNLKSKNKTEQLIIKENTTISALLTEVLKISHETDVGVFGKLMDKSYTLKDNDRVEFYERILIDPKIKRKSRAEK